jgi:hypothetical protein
MATPSPTTDEVSSPNRFISTVPSKRRFPVPRRREHHETEFVNEVEA